MIVTEKENSETGSDVVMKLRHGWRWEDHHGDRVSVERRGMRKWNADKPWVLMVREERCSVQERSGCGFTRELFRFPQNESRNTQLHKCYITTSESNIKGVYWYSVREDGVTFFSKRGTKDAIHSSKRGTIHTPILNTGGVCFWSSLQFADHILGLPPKAFPAPTITLTSLQKEGLLQEGHCWIKRTLRIFNSQWRWNPEDVQLVVVVVRLVVGVVMVVVVRWWWWYVKWV